MTIAVTVQAAFDGSTWQTPRADIEWTDITAYVKHSTGVTITRGRQGARDEVRAGTLSLTLLDGARLFDPENAAGDYYGFLNPGVPIRVFAELLDYLTWGDEALLWGGEGIDWSGSSHSRFFGFIEDWPQGYYNPADKRVEIAINATDAFGMLALGRQSSVLSNELLVDDPLAYWPLDESSGNVMRDRSGNMLDGEYTAGTTALSGQVGITRGLILDGEHVGVVTGRILDGNASVIEALVDLSRVDDLVDGDLIAIAELQGTDYVQWFGIEVMDADTRSVRLIHNGPSAAYPNFSYSAEFIADRPRYVDVLAIATGHPTLTPVRRYLLDGVEIPGGAFDAAAPTYTGIATGQRVGGSKANGPGRGGLSNVAVLPGSISGPRDEAHAEAALTPLDGQTTDERIDYLLDAAGFPSADRDLTAGYTTLGAADHDGEYTLDLIRRIEKTEQGRFFISQDGDATFHARYHGQLVASSVSATFSDDGSDSPYSTVEVNRPRQFVYNKVTVTTDGQSPVTVEDADSIEAHGERELTIDAPLLPTANSQRTLAEYALTIYKDPQPRVSGMTVPLHKDVTTLPGQVFPLEQGDRVNFERTPVNTGAALDWDQTLEGYTETFDTKTWFWTPNLSPAEPVTFAVWGGTGNAHEYGTAVWAY